MIIEKKYQIYKRICELAVNSFVLMYEKRFKVQIDANQNEHLLKDITSKIFTKILKSRRLEKFLKIGTLL